MLFYILCLKWSNRFHDTLNLEKLPHVCSFQSHRCYAFNFLACACILTFRWMDVSYGPLRRYSYSSCSCLMLVAVTPLRQSCTCVVQNGSIFIYRRLSSKRLEIITVLFLVFSINGCVKVTYKSVFILYNINFALKHIIMSLCVMNYDRLDKICIIINIITYVLASCQFNKIKILEYWLEESIFSYRNEIRFFCTSWMSCKTAIFITD